jgi:hypothetical protein
MLSGPRKKLGNMTTYSLGRNVDPSGCGASEGFTRAENPSAPSSPLLVGARIRSQLHSQYALLKSSDQMGGNSTAINDLTDLLSAAFPQGLNLDAAREALEAAGFSVFPVGANVLYPRGVYAAIEHYDTLGLGSVSVSVVIHLTADNLVQTVEGAFAFAMYRSVW